MKLLSLCLSLFQSQAEAHYRGSRHAKKLKSQENKAKPKLSISAETNGGSTSPAHPASVSSSTSQHTGRFYLLLTLIWALSLMMFSFRAVCAHLGLFSCLPPLFFFSPSSSSSSYSLQNTYPASLSPPLLWNPSSSPPPPPLSPPLPPLAEQGVSLPPPVPPLLSLPRASSLPPLPPLPKPLLHPLLLLPPRPPPRMLLSQRSQRRRRRRSCCTAPCVKSPSTLCLSWRLIMQVRRAEGMIKRTDLLGGIRRCI